jgi:hypothetical protein
MTLLIVDVSVARSSGNEKARNPDAVACRDALNAIRDNLNLKLLMTPEILEEWMKEKSDTAKPEIYASQYAVSWLAAMSSKGRVKRTNAIKVNEFDQCAREHLEPSKLAALLKDVHLFSAALSYDKKVISCDKKCWQYAIELKFCFPRVLQLHWVNPNDAYCFDWIRAGANDDSHWRPKDE